MRLYNEMYVQPDGYSDRQCSAIDSFDFHCQNCADINGIFTCWVAHSGRRYKC